MIEQIDEIDVELCELIWTGRSSEIPALLKPFKDRPECADWVYAWEVDRELHEHGFQSSLAILGPLFEETIAGSAAISRAKGDLLLDAVLGYPMDDPAVAKAAAEAKALLRAAIDREPRNEPARLSLARLLVHSDEWSAARDVLGVPSDWEAFSPIAQYCAYGLQLLISVPVGSSAEALASAMVTSVAVS